MINVHTINDEEEYNDARANVLFKVEGRENVVYLDKPNDGHPTIGYGFNLDDENVRNLVYLALGLDTSPGSSDEGFISELNGLFRQYNQGELTFAELTDNLNDKMANEPHGGDKTSFRFSEGDAGLAEMRPVLDHVADEKEKNQVDPLTGVTDKSYEKIALTSLAYNGILTSSSHLIGAIQSGDRAEAWYQIRFESNKGSMKADPPDIAPGIAKRRYYESQLFGLYDPGVDETTITEADATSIYQMYTRHRSHMLGYESRYGAGSTTNNMEEQANSDYHLVGTDYEVKDSQDAFLAASDYLTDEYVTSRGLGVTVDWRDIQMGHTGDDILQVTNRADYNLGGSASVNGLIVGGDGEDRINGQGGSDILYGGSGADYLDGGDGIAGDFFFGGVGDDTYIATNGDVLEDSDGAGRVVFGNALLIGGQDDGTGVYVGLDGDRYVLNNGTLTVTNPDNESVVINDFTNGDLGITLTAADMAQPPGNVITGSDFDDIDGDDDDEHNALRGTTGDDAIHGLAGNDNLFGDDGNDWLYGGDDTDFLNGLKGDDRLFGGTGRDILRGQGDNDILKAGNDGVALSGGDGTDTLIGGQSGDYMVGGHGEDTMVGGAGDDLLDGDGDSTPIVRDWSFAVVMGAPPYNISGVPTQVPIAISADSSEFQGTGHGGDQPPPEGEMADTIYGDAGNDFIAGFGGNDWLFGGANNDLVHGGWGDDHGYGGDGDDYLVGLYGSDSLHGNSGRDVIIAGSGDDYIYGGEGRDLLISDDLDFPSMVGNDYLDGGAGADYLAGGPGSDIVRGGAGQDTLSDSAGDDTYLLFVGDGVDFLVGSGGTNTVKFGDGIAYGDISAALVQDSNGTPYLQINYGSSDVLLIQNGQSGTVQNFTFSDGTTHSYQDVLNEISSASLQSVTDANSNLSTIPIAPVALRNDARLARRHHNRWTSMHRQLDRHLAMSSDGALGGDWNEKPGQAFTLAANDPFVDNETDSVLYGAHGFHLHGSQNAHGGLIRLK